MAQIFLSYRRSDSEYATGRIADRLTQTLGPDAVFRDVDSIEFGEDFEIRVRKILENCAVMLVIIGDEWLSVEDKDGKRRIDNPDDLVRREVVGAMENQDTRVIPVLIGDTVMPTEDQLPDDLKPFAKRNAATVRADANFDHQMKELIKVILERAPELSPTRRYSKRGGMVAGGILLVLVALWIVTIVSGAEDLRRIDWNESKFNVETLEMETEDYQAVHLYTGGETAPALGQGALKKYSLVPCVKLQPAVSDDGVVPDGDDSEFSCDESDTAAAEDVLKISMFQPKELPEDEEDARDHSGIFLHMQAGKQRGDVLVTVSYSNSDGNMIAPNEPLPVSVVPSPDMVLAATNKVTEVREARNISIHTDAEIRTMANNLLMDLNGNNFSHVLSPEQLQTLTDIRAKAETAATQFESANNGKRNAASLAEREAAWKLYLDNAKTLGRTESGHITTANEQLAEIESFRENTMSSVGYKACTAVVDMDCSGEKYCFPDNGKFSSWSRMKVEIPTATLVHELVADDGSVAQSDDINVTSSPGYRNPGTFRNVGAGDYTIRVRYGDVVVASAAVKVGDCS